MVVGDKTYFVPLWHNELYFGDEKSNEGEIIVKCVPELPENISIDENNNLLGNSSNSDKKSKNVKTRNRLSKSERYIEERVLQ